MTKLLAASTKFVRDEEGASLVEYGLLLSLVAVVCIVAITLLGTSISTMFIRPGRQDLSGRRSFLPFHTIDTVRRNFDDEASCRLHQVRPR